MENSAPFATEVLVTVLFLWRRIQEKTGELEKSRL